MHHLDGQAAVTADGEERRPLDGREDAAEVTLERSGLVGGVSAGAGGNAERGADEAGQTGSLSGQWKASLLR